jgi:hypothetical protein
MLSKTQKGVTGAAFLGFSNAEDRMTRMVLLGVSSAEYRMTRGMMLLAAAMASLVVSIASYNGYAIKPTHDKSSFVLETYLHYFQIPSQRENPKYSNVGSYLSFSRSALLRRLGIDESQLALVKAWGPA